LRKHHAQLVLHARPNAKLVHRQADHLYSLERCRELLRDVVEESGLAPAAHRFQATLRALLLGEDQTLAKSYLRFLVDQIIVRGNEIEIRGKTRSAVALLASASNSDLATGAAPPEAVLVSVGDWLRK
jgi:hypothetical protein